MKKNRLILAIIILIITISIMGIIYTCVKYLNGIEIVQLSSQSTSQMMGYFLKTNKDKTIVIDGGTEADSNNLKRYIDTNNGIVDYWIITHGHNDHIGAMVLLLEKDEVQVKNIVCSLNDLKWYQEYDSGRSDIVERLYNVLDNNQDIEIKDAEINETLIIDNLDVEILGIKNPEITTNSGNNQSMVFKIHINDKSILFLGDLGEEGSKKIIESNGDKLKSYAVQMSHHGQAGATEELYQLVDPEICFWPTPEWLWDNNLDGKGYNTGNWKTLETREWMNKLNVKENYISKDGDIIVKIW